MNEVSDEVLMAYADGELDDGVCAEIQSALERSPELRSRLRAFEVTGRQLNRVFDGIVEAPVPDQLVAHVRGAPNGAKVISFSGARDAALASAGLSGADAVGAKGAFDRFYRYALVASIAAVVVGIGSTFWKPPLRPNSQDLPGVAVLKDGLRIADKALASGLDTMASGATAIHNGDGVQLAVKPTFSFKANTGLFCRQYIVETGAPSTAFAGVACRGANGRWQIEKQVAFDKKGAGSKGIVPASGDGVPLIDAVVDGLIDGDVFGGDEEQKLLANGWKTPSSQK